MDNKFTAFPCDEIDRAIRLGSEPFFVWAFNYTHNEERADFVAQQQMGIHSWTKSRLKKSLDALASEGVIIIIEPFKLGGYLVKWGPSAAEMNRFFDMVGCGATVSQAKGLLLSEGVPDPGEVFWRAKAKEVKRGVAELSHSIAEYTGADGEIYGHR